MATSKANRYPLTLAILLLVLAALGFVTLLRTPPPHVDEAYRASRAYALIRTGRAFGILEAGVYDRYEGYWTFFPFLETWFTALPIRLLGLSLWALRLTSLAFGLVLLGALYAIGDRLGGPVLGLVTVFLVGFSKSFIYSSHLARQDIIVAAFGFGAIALYLADRGSRFTGQALLAGLLAGLAFEVHPNGMIYAPVVIALCLVENGRSILRAGRFRAFLTGVGAGLACYVAIHILPYPQTYRALTQLGYSATHTPPFLAPNPLLWLRGLYEAGFLLHYISRTHTLLGLLAIPVLLQRHSPADRRLLVLLGTLFLAVGLCIRNKLYYYGILYTPALELLLAAALLRLAQISRQAFKDGKRWLALASGLAVLGSGLFLAVTIVHNLAPLRENALPDYEKAAARIRQAVPPGSTVMGTQTFWFAMPDERYLSWEQLVYYQRYAPGTTLEDGLREFRPDYLIVDSHLRHYIIDLEGPPSGYRGALALPKADWDRFLAERGRLVEEIETRNYGQVDVYRITWP